MMAKSFAISCGQQRLAGRERECTFTEHCRQARAVAQSIAESNLTGNRAIESQDGQLQIVVPPQKRATIVPRTTEIPLVASQHNKADSGLCNCGESISVHSTFWQPYAFRLAAEPCSEVLDPPGNLQLPISRIEQRQD